ncbi:MAG TPA: hypothetical protein VG841_13140 [Caulobacterales bacterium]|nr:hypothetical protein [Caulobacterales bacterium]
MAYAVTEIYEQIRAQALSLTQTQLGVDADPYGLLMEIGYPPAAVSLFSAADGAASLCFSNGGGMIGAGEHQSVAAAAKKFVQAAGLHRHDMGAATEFPLPEPGETRFCVLTATGVLTAAAPEEALGRRRHPLWPLFYAGQDVLTAMRETQQLG